MALWVRGFVIPQVAEVHVLFGQLIRTAEQIQAAVRTSPLEAGAVATLSQLRAAYVDFNDELQVTAQQAAAQAVADIRQRLADTQVRPDTGESPHLRDLIVAKPLSTGGLATGMVGVGLVSALNRAINRNSPGYGPYWRAQEYGTGYGEVPSQVGRVLYGYFAAAGGGDPTPPQATYAGGGGPHPIFLAKRPQYRSATERSRLSATGAGSTRSGPAGFGTIGHEIKPRRFIGFGADAAAVLWRDRVELVQQQALDRLAAIGAP